MKRNECLSMDTFIELLTTETEQFTKIILTSEIFSFDMAVSRTYNFKRKTSFSSPSKVQEGFSSSLLVCFFPSSQIQVYLVRL